MSVERGVIVVIVKAGDTPLAGALVKVAEVGTLENFVSHTDAEGKVRFHYLAQGNYKVRVEAEGFVPQDYEQVIGDNRAHAASIIIVTDLQIAE